MRIRKVLLFGNYVIAVMYLAAFEKFLLASVRSVAPPLEVPVKAIMQGMMFIPPFILCWYGIKSYRFLAALFIMLNIALFFFSFNAVMFVPTLTEFKAVFVPLLFFPMLEYLVRTDPNFDARITNALMVIACLFALVSLFEIFSYIFFPNPVNDWLRTIGDRQMENWYPESLYNRFSAGALFGTVALYALLFNRNALFFFFSLMCILTMAKTRIAAFLLVILMFLLVHVNIKLLFRIGVGIAFVGLVSFYVVPKSINPLLNLSDQFNVQVIEGALVYGSVGTKMMADDLIHNSADIVKASLLPHGIFGYSDDSLGGFSRIQEELAMEYPVTEVAFLKYLYGFGSLAMVLYFYAIYSPLFSFREGWIMKNRYKIILLFSLSSLLHYFDLNFLALYIFVMYISIKANERLQPLSQTWTGGKLR